MRNKPTKSGFLGLFLSAFAVVAGLPSSALCADVLFVHSTQGSNPTNAGDQLLISRIQNVLGFSVTPINQNDGAAAMQAAAATHKMVFVSESVSSGGVAATFLNTLRPVVVAEPLIWDDMNLSQGGVLSGYSNGIKTVNILQPGHPLAAGLSGNGIQVYSQDPAGTVWGTPAPSALVIMETPDITNSTLIPTHFLYNTGDIMVNGFVAPAPRLAFALQNLGRTDISDSSNAYLNLNSAGLAIFDASIRYFVPEPSALLLLAVGSVMLRRRSRATVFFRTEETGAECWKIC